MTTMLIVMIRSANSHIAQALLRLYVVPAGDECADDRLARHWVFGVGSVAKLQSNSGTKRDVPRQEPV